MSLIMQSLLQKRKNTLKTKNACTVIVPADAFVSSDLKPITGEIEIHVTEYNNPAEFIASGIPMSYMAEGKLFMYHSEEMLSIKAFQNAKPIELKSGINITLNCRAVDSLYETGFYKFNLQEHKWFEEEKQSSITEVNVEDPKTQLQKKKTRQLTPDPTQETVVTNKEKTKNSPKENPTESPEQKNAVNTDENIKSDLEKTPLEISEKEVNIKEETSTATDTTYGKATGTTKEIQKIKPLRIDTGWYTKARIDSGNGRNNYFKPRSFLPSCCLARLYIALGKSLSKKPLDLSGLDSTYQLDKNHENIRRYVEQELKYSDESLPEKKYYPIRIETKKLTESKEFSEIQ